MGRRRQPFINKRDALRFNVVHRSQRDPRLADPEASDFVLKQVAGTSGSGEGGGAANSASLQQLARDVAEDESALRTMDEHDREMDAGDDAHFERFAAQAAQSASASGVGGGKKKAGGGGDKPWLYSREAFDHAYLGLPEDDGYDYSQHLRETGGGVYFSKDGKIKAGRAPKDVLVPEEVRKEYEAAEKAAELVRAAKKAGASGSFVPKEALGTDESELTPYSEFVSSQPGLFEGVDLEIAAMLDGDVEIAEGEELEDDFVTLAMMDELPPSRAGPGAKKGQQQQQQQQQQQKQQQGQDQQYHVEYEEEYEEYSSDDGAAAGSSDDGDEYGNFVARRGYYKDGDEPRGPGSERTERESLASTMSRRTQSVRVIDERFEESLKAYDEDDEIGELDPDDEDLQGHLDTDQIDGLLDEFLNDAKSQRKEAIQVLDKEDREATMRAANKAADLTDAEAARLAEEEIDAISKPRQKEQWDCETVISTYSNLENHPKLIEVRRPARGIRLERGMPVDYLPTRSRAEQQDGGDDSDGNGDDQGEEEEDGDEDEDEDEDGIAIPMRVKGETAEEKRQRKNAVKEAKREARMRKKELKSQFKREELRQTKQRKQEVSVRPL